MRVKYSNAHLNLIRQRCNLKRSYLNKRVFKTTRKSLSVFYVDGKLHHLPLLSTTKNKAILQPGAHSVMSSQANELLMCPRCLIFAIMSWNFIKRVSLCEGQSFLLSKCLKDIIKCMSLLFVSLLLKTISTHKQSAATKKD
jgi:hypothetical protein